MKGEDQRSGILDGNVKVDTYKRSMSYSVAGRASLVVYLEMFHLCVICSA